MLLWLQFQQSGASDGGDLGNWDNWDNGPSEIVIGGKPETVKDHIQVMYKVHYKSFHEKKEV